MRPNKNTFETLVTDSLEGNADALRKITELCLLMGLDSQKASQFNIMVDAALNKTPKNTHLVYLKTLALCNTEGYSPDRISALEKIIAQEEKDGEAHALACVALAWLLLTDGEILNHTDLILTPPTNKVAQRISDLLLDALAQQEPLAFGLMTCMLLNYENIDPAKHFKAAKIPYIDNSQLSPEEKAKQFLTLGTKINTFTTFLSLLFFFRNTDALTIALKKLDPSGDVYHLALSSLLKTDHLRLAPVYFNQLIEFIATWPIPNNNLGTTGETHIILCQLYLLFNNDENAAQKYFEMHPNKKQALKSLLNTVTDRLENPDANLEETQALLRFAIENGADSEQANTVNYITLKMHFFKGNDESALKHYEQHVPDYYPLTANEYFKLGNAMYAKFQTIPENDKKAHCNKILDLFYKAYTTDKKNSNPLLQAPIKRIAMKVLPDLQVDHQQNDHIGNIFENFLKERRDQLSKSNHKLQIASLKAYKFLCQNRPVPKPGLDIFIPTTDLLEVECIDQLVENLQKGRSLHNIMKDQEIAQPLKKCPLLMKFINEELLPLEDNKISHPESAVSLTR